MLYSIYAESTPNPEVMKFVSNRILTGVAIEINSKLDAKVNPIAQELFKFPFIKRVYINNNFISVFKKKNANWEDIAMQIRTFITDFLNNNDIEIKKDQVNQVKSKEKEPQVSSKRKKEIFEFIDNLLKNTGKVGKYDQKI